MLGINRGIQEFHQVPAQNTIKKENLGILDTLEFHRYGREYVILPRVRSVKIMVWESGILKISHRCVH